MTKSDKTRKRLLDAASLEFSTFGLAGARVDRIAAAEIDFFSGLVDMHNTGDASPREAGSRPARCFACPQFRMTRGGSLRTRGGAPRRRRRRW